MTNSYFQSQETPKILSGSAPETTAITYALIHSITGNCTIIWCSVFQMIYILHSLHIGF